jgi:hypothetical protein
MQMLLAIIATALLVLPLRAAARIGEDRSVGIRKVPLAKLALIDRLVGAVQQRRRHGKAERFGSREINHQFEFGRLLDKQIVGPVTFHDPVDVVGRAPEERPVIGSI